MKKRNNPMHHITHPGLVKKNILTLLIISCMIFCGMNVNLQRSHAYTDPYDALSDLSISVTTRSGTVMNNGDVFNLPAQEVNLKQVDLAFTVTQDGTLKAGDKIRIPVELTNNANATYYANLGSGVDEKIQGVGSIKFEHPAPDKLAYVITIDSDFGSKPAGFQRAAAVTQKAATGANFKAKSSKSNVVLKIDGSTFSFKPVPRQFPKTSGPFTSYNILNSTAANLINVGTSLGDANYYNNLLGTGNPGETGIPHGQFIVIKRVKVTQGSEILKANIKPNMITSTLTISEDGTYMVKGDTATSIALTSLAPKNITLPADATDEQIISALKSAGKNARAVIKNSDGTYTLATNLGKLRGPDATTYHDFRPQDDFGTFGDQFQEIDRTDAVNNILNAKLATASALQGFGVSAEIRFTSASEANHISSVSKHYDVPDNGSATLFKSENNTAHTTPSVARSAGQSKITVRHVDTDGHEIEVQDFKYGYYPGNGLKPTSPDFPAAPKTIADYTLVTEANSIASVPGTQLTAGGNIAFESNDKNFYFVYARNKSKAEVAYIDDTTGGTVLHTEHLEGTYGSTSTYRTTDKINEYKNQGYEKVSDNYPAGGVQFNAQLQKFEVHLKHKEVESTETKNVKLTVRYSGAGSKTPPDNVQNAVWTRKIKTDKVTNAVTEILPWTPDKVMYNEVPSPPVAGYMPDLQTVPAEAVTQSDIVRDVVYTGQIQKVTYTVIDDTDGSKLKDKEPLVSGNSDKPLPASAQGTYDNIIKSYEDNNYVLVSKDPLPANFDDDTTVDQNVTVHLRHKTEEKTYDKESKLTVRYHGAGSNTPPNNVQKVKWTRKVKVDKVTGTETETVPWTPAKNSYDEVLSPVIPGYTADPLKVPAETVTQDDIYKDVNYRGDGQHVTYTVIDETENKTLEDSSMLASGPSDTNLPASAQTDYEQVVKGYENQGYELVSKDSLPAKFDNDTAVDQNVKIRLKHGTKIEAEEKNVTLTVHYHGAGNQTPPDNVQNAKWTRSVTKDKVTGNEISATQWISDKAKYNKVDSPVISGYTADIRSITEETVTMMNIVRHVNYSPVPAPTPTPNKPGGPVPNSPDNPKPGTPATPNTPQKPKPKTPPTKGTVKKTAKKKTPVKQEQVSEARKKHAGNLKDPDKKEVSRSNDPGQPKTGDNTNLILYAGLLITAALTLTILLLLRKRNQKNNN